MNAYIRGHIFQRGWSAFRLCSDLQTRRIWFRSLRVVPHKTTKHFKTMSYIHKCQVYRDLGTVLPRASHELHWTKGQCRISGSAFLQICWQCQQLCTRYLHIWHRWLSPEADFRSAHASRGCSAVCEATRAGRGWAGQAKAEIGVSAAPSYHSLKAEIPHRKCTNSSLSTSVQIDATVLHTSAALVSGRKRCEK